MMNENTISFKTIGIQPTDVYAVSSQFETIHLTLPSSHHSTGVRSVNCGGTFFVVRLCPSSYSSDSLWNGEGLYVKFTTPSNGKKSEYLKPLSPSSSDSNNNQLYNPFYLLDYKSAMEKLDLGKCYEIENVYCTQSMIILQMKNNVILGIDPSTENAFCTKLFIDSGIREIICGPLSFHMLVHGIDGVLYYFNLDSPNFATNEKLNLDFTNRKFVTAALSGRSSFVVYEKEDGSHHILSHGDDQFSVQNGQPSNDIFSELKTPFEGRRVHQIKCGYFHTCVLLEDGDVYMCGYNAYTQCGVPGNDQKFVKLLFPKLPLGPPTDLPEIISRVSDPQDFQPTRVICSSIATLFANKEGFIIIGDPVSGFTKKHQFFGTVNCIYQEFNQHTDSLNIETVECGGWHFVIYNKKIMESKNLIYFYDNLKKVSGTLCFSDLQFK